MNLWCNNPDSPYCLNLFLIKTKESFGKSFSVFCQDEHNKKEIKTFFCHRCHVIVHDLLGTHTHTSKSVRQKSVKKELSLIKLNKRHEKMGKTFFWIIWFSCLDENEDLDAKQDSLKQNLSILKNYWIVIWSVKPNG